MNDPKRGAAARELVFLCQDTGIVVSMSFRPGVDAGQRVVVFLANSETVYIDPRIDPDARCRVTMARGDAGLRQVTMSGYGARMESPAWLAETRAMPSVHGVPAGITVSVAPEFARPSPYDRSPTPEAPGTLVRVTGSLAIGSLVFPIHGRGWSATSAVPRSAVRARAVFQDGSAAYVCQADGHDVQADAASVASLAVDEHIHDVPLYELSLGQAEDGGLGTFRSSLGGRRPTDLAGERRDAGQSLSVSWRAAGDRPWTAWQVAPFSLVRSGVTGIGLVERHGEAPAPALRPHVEAGLPDPF